MKNKNPVVQGRIPLFFDIHQGKVDGLLGGLVVSELNLGLDILPDPPVHIFNRVGRVDDPADLHGKIKIAGQVVPVGFPGVSIRRLPRGVWMI